MVAIFLWVIIFLMLVDTVLRVVKYHCSDKEEVENQ